jgi:hypothetical protein
VRWREKVDKRGVDKMLVNTGSSYRDKMKEQQ